MSSGVYGDMLAFFPELLRDYDVFTMNPKMGAGYMDKTLFMRIEGGYFTRNKGGDQSVVTNLKTENQRATFYLPDEVPRGVIKQGLYVEDDGELYTFINDNAFVREGGFIAYKMQLVTGSNGRQTAHTRVNLGPDQFS